MEMFFLSLQQLLMMATLIIVGYILRVKNIVPENSGSVISKLETFVFVPALSFVTMLDKCTVENFVKNSSLMIYGLIFIVAAVALAYPVSRLFVRNADGNKELEYQRNIYKYALTFGNFGFMGNFIVLGIWGSEMFYKYHMLTFFVSVVCYSWGFYVLIPKGHANLRQNLKKGLLGPPMVATVVGIICGLLNLKQYFPEFAISALDNASKCMGPAAMLLAGIVIGGYDVKKLLSDKKVYAITFLRLIVIPALFMIILKLVGTSTEVMTLLLICFATPLGLNTIVYPAAFGGDTKTGAAMAVISHTLSVITIPVMYYLFIVLL